MKHMLKQPTPLDADKRWQQVLARQAEAGAPFVYAVTTTGIFCRPDCAARRPKRAHVRFFDTPEGAQAAGFRPCKRCRPAGDAGPPHASAIAAACARIESAATEPGLDALARTAGLSPAHFQRLFKAQVGLSPKQYARAVRKRRLRGALPGARTVADAIYEAGYETSSRAYADMGGSGLSPEAFRKGHTDETIRYATAGTSLGPVFVAATDKGVCMIEFGEDTAMRDRLKTAFPEADMEPAHGRLADWIRTIIAMIDKPGEGQNTLPLDIRGTAFQERVWQALQAIPPGETLSYAGLAEKIGRPGAARAVAGACAANRLAVAVPCHRIVRSNGSISGYKWGTERKRRLLDRERQAAGKTS